MIINVKEVLGDKINIEDAIILRDIIKSSIKEGISIRLLRS